MYGFGGVGLSEVQISISELSVVGGWVVVVGGGQDKRTSWSDLHRVRQKLKILIQYIVHSFNDKIQFKRIFNIKMFRNIFFLSFFIRRVSDIVQSK